LEDEQFSTGSTREKGFFFWTGGMGQKKIGGREAPEGGGGGEGCFVCPSVRSSKIEGTIRLASPGGKDASEKGVGKPTQVRPKAETSSLGGVRNIGLKNNKNRWKKNGKGTGQAIQSPKEGRGGKKKKCGGAKESPQKSFLSKKKNIYRR